MSRRSHDFRLTKQISIRLQRIIEERFGSLYAFAETLRARGRNALASTVRGWLPPQRAWKSKPNGAGVKPVDGKAVRIPDGTTLIEFCDLLSVRADYILFGEGTPSRDQPRTTTQLADDVAAHIAEALLAHGYKHWSASNVDGTSVLTEAVRLAKEEATGRNGVLEASAARIAAGGYSSTKSVAWDRISPIPRMPGFNS
jgi:hypothetical protein